MSVIIDRRLNGKNKSGPNRQRFLRRVRANIKKTIDDVINNSDIQDIGKGDTEITVNRKDLSEPTFSHNSKTGRRTGINPGNKEFQSGDKVPKPQGGQGEGGSKGSNDPEVTEDDFTFLLSQDEFLDFLFDDLELPHLIEKNLKSATEFVTKRAGYSTSGNPANLNVIKSFEKSIGRRLAMKSPLKRKLIKLEVLLLNEEDEEEIERLEQEVEEMKRKIKAVPFIDDFDLKFNAHRKEPVPATSAVMFRILDVSGSMGEEEKILAKKFFVLLYLFLTKCYDNVDVVNIRHHTIAKEVDEEEFFGSRESGGTIVSGSLEKMVEIATERYSGAEWNIYATQCSDGDNWESDNQLVMELLEKKILPMCQYFAYIETMHGKDSFFSSDGESDLWKVYKDISDPTFAMQQVQESKDIYPVFRKLFAKK